MHRSLLLLGGALLLGATSLFARVRLEVEIISLPPAAAVTLVPALRDRATFDAAWQRLQTMQEAGEATLLACPQLWLKSGDRVVSETLTEWKYPVKFNPPGVPHQMTPEEVARDEVLDHLPQWGPDIPIAFETRNLGAVVEAEATESKDSPIITLNLEASFTQLLERKVWPRPPTPSGMGGSTERPDFTHFHCGVGGVNLRNGERRLVSVSAAQRPAPAVVLLFVRASRFPDHP